MSNIPTTYTYVHYDREQIKQQVCSFLLYPSSGNFRNIPMNVIPIIRSSTELKMKNTLSTVLSPYISNVTNQQEMVEYTYLDIPIMFEFHCKQMIDNGTLAKRFGQHDDATLKKMYTDQILKDKDMVEKLKSYANSKTAYTPKELQEVLDLLKLIRDRLGDRFNVQPIHDIHNTLKPFEGLGNLYLNGVNNEFDLSEYFPVVPDNATDNDLLALYDRYPNYKSSTCEWSSSQIYLPNGMYGGNGSYPDGFEFVMCIDRKTIVSMFTQAASSCQNRNYTSEKKEWIGYNSRVVGYETTCYTYDQQAVQEFSKYTLEQIMALAEELWAKNPNEAYTAGRNKLRELKTKEMVVLRFNKQGNFIA